MLTVMPRNSEGSDGDEVIVKYGGRSWRCTKIRGTWSKVSMDAPGDRTPHPVDGAAAAKSITEQVYVANIVGVPLGSAEPDASLYPENTLLAYYQP